MNMSAENILVILVVGIAAGWLAGKVVRGTGFGLVGDLLIGIAGALFAGLLLLRLGLNLGGGILSQILFAALGAIILLLFVGLVRGRRA